MDEIVKTIDVEKIIRNAKSIFIRSLPGFVVRFLIKIIHQDEMNDVIYRNREKTGVPFINDVLKDWNVTVNIVNENNIPASGRFFFVANHSVGAMDSLSFLSMIYRHYPDVISPSNELFDYIPNLKPVILGINVFGKNSRETAEKLNNLCASERQIMIFPSGEVSRRKKGVISDPEWQKTFITKAILYKRDIIPVHISGRNSNLFYFIANLRKLLGIKLFIESALLPREMIKQRNSTFTLTVGQPIPYQTFTAEKTHQEWARHVKNHVYELTRK